MTKGRHERLTDALPAPSGTLEEQYRLIREGCGRLDFSGLAKLRLTGEDRKGWLQGQVTNDLRPINDGGHSKFCVLTPTGQIVAACDLWAVDSEFVMIFEGVQRESALERLNKMLILEDVAIEDMGEQWRLVSVQGPSTTETLSEAINLPRLSAGLVDGLRLFRSDRTGSGGWDIVYDEAHAGRVMELLQAIPAVGDGAWEAARIEAGIPVYGKDMNERTLAMEMGDAFVESHISFSKGCYTGQEVVERIRSRGHTNKRWVGLLSDSHLTPGDVVGEAGAVTSAAASPEFGFVGAATLKNDIPFGATVSVGNASAEVVRMPIRG